MYRRRFLTFVDARQLIESRRFKLHGFPIAPPPAPPSTGVQSTNKSPFSPPDTLQRWVYEQTPRGGPAGTKGMNVGSPSTMSSVPPPAPHVTQQPSATSSSPDGGRSNVVLAEKMIDHMPTYFVPWDCVQPSLGADYTLEHITKYYGSSGAAAVEVVSLSGHGGGQFVRFHGHKGGFSMMRCYATNAKHDTDDDAAVSRHSFSPWKPDMQLAKEILQLFPASKRWMFPIDELLDRLPDSIKERLFAPIFAHQGVPKEKRTLRSPYPEAALLFFAQLQHLFTFQGPNATFPGRVGKAVFGEPPARPLAQHTSPCPIAFNELVRVLRLQNVVDMHSLPSLLEDRVLEDIRHYFGNDNEEDGLDSFVRWHATTQYVMERHGDTTVLVSHEQKRRQERATLPLEQQLAELKAQPKPNKRIIRRVERKILQSTQGVKVLPTRHELAAEVAKFLPNEGSVDLGFFLRKLPAELNAQLPPRKLDLFRKHRSYFKVFENRTPGKYYVQRPHLPLPPTAIKQDFTDMEIVNMCCLALYRLQPETKTMTVSKIQMHIPNGARDHVKRHHGEFLRFAAKHPRYFVLAVPRPDEVGANEASSRITAIACPTREELAAAEDAAGFE